MYPKKPDGMFSGPAYCKLANFKINVFRASFSKAFFVLQFICYCFLDRLFNFEICILNWSFLCLALLENIYEYIVLFCIATSEQINVMFNGKKYIF